MDDYLADMIRRREDLQSQLDALMGEAPGTAAILEGRIASYDRIIERERAAQEA